ncbi:hypothetical protein IJ21_25720 [Paenibacillus sp. 32O-W]|jgi:hypothetical protein|nr:hypothetical protein IJ21_25720 [Paenibacillus sp. 32O-W]
MNGIASRGMSVPVWNKKTGAERGASPPASVLVPEAARPYGQKAAGKPRNVPYAVSLKKPCCKSTAIVPLP